MKIALIEIANFKRLKAIRVTPNESGFTTFGGKNCQGKTSVLDGIQFGFGGYKFKPTNMKREGSVGDMVLRFETDNGLVIDRHGKDGKTLTVTDKDGKRGGQALLDAFLSELAIDLPKFHDSDSKTKAKMLLGTLKMTPELAEKLGVSPESDISEILAKFDKDEKSKYDTRTVIGQQADQKSKAAKDMPYHDDVGEEPVSAKELIEKSQAILSRNGVKENAKRELERSRQAVEQNNEQIASLRNQIESINKQIAGLEESNKRLQESIALAEKEDYTLESTDEIQKQIDEIEETNRKINENRERSRRVTEADELSKQYDNLTKEIEAVRAERLALLEGITFPLEGLSVQDGELTYHGKAWDCMSGSEQLIVDIAIASSLNPECKFVLLDKLEQLDIDSLREADKWLVEHDIQCIATRVSTNTDKECSFVIEDGEIEGQEDVVVQKKPAPKAPEPKNESALPEY